MISYEQWTYLINIIHAQLLNTKSNMPTLRILKSIDNSIFQNYIHKLLYNHIFSFAKITYIILLSLDAYIPNIVYLIIQENVKLPLHTKIAKANKEYTLNKHNYTYIETLINFVKLIIHISAQMEYNLNIYLLTLLSINCKHNIQPSLHYTSTSILANYANTYLAMQNSILPQNLSLLLMSTISLSQDKFTQKNLQILEYLDKQCNMSKYETVHKTISIASGQCLDRFICSIVTKAEATSIIIFVLEMLHNVIIPYKQAIITLIEYIKTYNNGLGLGLGLSLELGLADTYDAIANNLDHLIFNQLETIKSKLETNT
uniref:Uncharacterized protein n=1 Tax=viral metagenome TaxID=1070528 RepID=A0A6C0HM19_9ZZZZ